MAAADTRKTRAIFLAGFMGSGKSTVGKLLAERLGWEFIDLDERIEDIAGKPIPQVFEDDGEDEFRRIEHEAAHEQAKLAIEGAPRVVALGGGTFAYERNRRVIAEAGLSVWLDAPAETLWERIHSETHRPLAQDPDQFRTLLESRRESYAKADLRIDASFGPERIADEILKE